MYLRFCIRRENPRCLCHNAWNRPSYDRTFKQHPSYLRNPREIYCRENMQLIEKRASERLRRFNGRFLYRANVIYSRSSLVQPNVTKLSRTMRENELGYGKREIMYVLANINRNRSVDKTFLDCDDLLVCGFINRTFIPPNCKEIHISFNTE